MLASGGATLNFALSLLTCVLWITALLLPSWFVFSTKSSHTSVLPESAVIVKETHIGLFYIYQCSEDWCWQSITETKYRPYSRIIPAMLELQIESVSALSLGALSCIVLLFPMKSTPKTTSARFLIVCIILPIAYILDIILIIRATSAYQEMSEAFTELNRRSLLKVEMSFPTSILVSGIGILFAITSWVLSIIMYRMSRKKHVQNMGDGIFMSKE